jgi:peptidoglycan biosynthesis protein MviN/MurJ (putative lipid II flippase)
MIFITIICFIINVGGNMYLIPKLGILGLCFVKIASYGSQVFSSSILNHRNEIKYHYPYTKMYLITASVAAIIGLYYIPFPMYIYTLLFKSIVAIIIIFAFYIYTNKKYKLNNLITQQLQKFNIIK